MALSSSLNTALSGVQASMAALQTIGHNIANANTPGYSRQRVELQARNPQDLVFAQIGRGVNLARVRRVVDITLEARMRDASSSLARFNIRSDTLQQMESLFNALSDQDLAAGLDRLFTSVEDLVNTPDNVSSRNQVLQNAQSLAQNMNFLSTRIRETRAQLNSELQRGLEEVNRLTTNLAELNREVQISENGGFDINSANDLRDRRDLLVRQLSEFVDVRGIETSTGELNLLVGSSFLVFGQQAFALSTDDTVDEGVIVSTPVFASGTASLIVSDGKLRGLIDARDQELKGFLKELHQLANTVIHEFNRIQSTGQGLERFSDLTSLHGVGSSANEIAIEGSVTSPVLANTIVDSSLVGFPDLTGRRIMMFSGDAALETRQITGFDSSTGTFSLDEPFLDKPSVGDRFQVTDLSFPVTNGSFDVVLTNELTGLQESFNITVDLDKNLPDESMASVAAQITAASPLLTASLTSTNQLRVRTSSNDVRFSFANDTSGFLAAAGMNAFFDGVNAESIAVNPALLNKPEFLSAAKSSAAGDNSNALEFATLRTRAVSGAASLEDMYQNLVGRLGVETATNRDLFENQQLLASQLESQRERVSGVNIDEEVIHMMEFQRAFQASARFISVVDSLMETLMTAI